MKIDFFFSFSVKVVKFACVLLCQGYAHSPPPPPPFRNKYQIALLVEIKRSLCYSLAGWKLLTGLAGGLSNSCQRGIVKVLVGAVSLGRFFSSECVGGRRHRYAIVGDLALGCYFDINSNDAGTL